MTTFFSSGQTGAALQLSSVHRAWTIYQDDLVSRYMAGQNALLTPALSLFVLLPLVLAAVYRKRPEKRWPYMALGIWLVVGMTGLSFYRQEIYDHYLGFVNPAPYLLLGGAVAFLKKYWQLGTVFVLALVLGFVNLQLSPLRQPPNNQLARTQEITRFVISESGGKPFNFALLAKNNYDSAYQFYFWLYKDPPPQVHEIVANQLFVVCEDSVCQPVGNPKDEIAAFGMAKIDKTYEILGTKVYRLTHNPSGAPG